MSEKNLFDGPTLAGLLATATFAGSVNFLGRKQRV
jgi:hypothetical protein